jgi:hypothetical protein
LLVGKEQVSRRPEEELFNATTLQQMEGS